MKERPILFSGPMVRAIFDGTKTQTRRVVKPPKNVDPEHWMPEKFWDGQFNALHWPADHAEHEILKCPYGQPGDRLWVRETFAEIDCRLTYKADFNDGAHCVVKRWIPSIHMPRWASRITLEITDVRVERLQNISEQDAWAEGCLGWDDDVTGGSSGYGEFSELWVSINGVESWNSNPWVWVVEFRRVEQ